MKRVRVSEYARKIGKNESTVRKWINTGRLKTSTEIINNRNVTVVLVNDDDPINFNDPVSMQDLIEQNKTSYNTIQDNIQYAPENHTNSTNNEFLEKMYEDNMRLVADVKKYAELAGQAKLLTDSEHQTKQEYFQTIQENKVLSEAKAKLEATTQLLTNQVNELKKEAQDKAELKAELKLKDQQLKELQEKMQAQNKSSFENWLKKL